MATFYPYVPLKLEGLSGSFLEPVLQRLLRDVPLKPIPMHPPTSMPFLFLRQGPMATSYVLGISSAGRPGPVLLTAIT